MEWTALIPILVQNAPAAIKTAMEFFEWAKKMIAGAAEAYSKPASDITADELLAHIVQIKRQEADTQAIP